MVPQLDRSLSDLATFGSRLRSIAGVPVGLSRHGQERQSRQLRLSRTCMRTLPGKQIAVRRYHDDEAWRSSPRLPHGRLDLSRSAVIPSSTSATSST